MEGRKNGTDKQNDMKKKGDRLARRKIKSKNDTKRRRKIKNKGLLALIIQDVLFCHYDMAM